MPDFMFQDCENGILALQKMRTGQDAVLSHVVQAIAVPQEYAHGTVRITLGMGNTTGPVDKTEIPLSGMARAINSCNVSSTEGKKPGPGPGTGKEQI